MLLGEVLDRTDSFGEPHLEAGAPIGHIGEFDPPIHATHETCRYEEPQTCSPPWFLRGKKRIEYVGVIFWRQARPVVRHGDHDNPLTRVEIPESVHAEIIARTATVEVIDSGRVSLTPAKKMRRGSFLAPECDLDGGRVPTLYGVDGIEEKIREHQADGNPEKKRNSPEKNPERGKQLAAKGCRRTHGLVMPEGQPENVRA